MAHLHVLTNPNDKLREISEEVDVSVIKDDEIQELIEDMIETMHLENGVGIAAPQVGIHRRIIIADIGKGPVAFVNPKIVSKSLKKNKSEEGCLSVPGVFGIVKRHKKVKVKALDREGKEVIIKADHLAAIIFQHEIDHLDGILFIDKITHETNPQKM